jgi:hypothetical protein
MFFLYVFSLFFSLIAKGIYRFFGGFPQRLIKAQQFDQNESSRQKLIVGSSCTRLVLQWWFLF